MISIKPKTEDSPQNLCTNHTDPMSDYSIPPISLLYFAKKDSNSTWWYNNIMSSRDRKLHIVTLVIKLT